MQASTLFTIQIKAQIFTPLKKTTNQNTLAKGDLKEIFCPHFPVLQLLFSLCKKSLSVPVLPSLSSNALSVSNLRISPDHARGRADHIFHRLVVAVMVHRLGRAQWVHHAAVSRWHRCAAVLEAELLGRGNSNSSRPIKSFSLPVRQTQIIPFYRKEHFVVYLALLVRAEYLKHTKI